jgi:hypothetical protein
MWRAASNLADMTISLYDFYRGQYGNTSSDVFIHSPEDDCVLVILNGTLSLLCNIGNSQKSIMIKELLVSW